VPKTSGRFASIAFCNFHYGAIWAKKPFQDKALPLLYLSNLRKARSLQIKDINLKIKVILDVFNIFQLQEPESMVSAGLSDGRKIMNKILPFSCQESMALSSKGLNSCAGVTPRVAHWNKIDASVPKV